MYTISVNPITGELETDVDPSQAMPLENIPADTTAALNLKEDKSAKGEANGYPELDEDAQVPEEQLPAKALTAGSLSVPRDANEYIVVVAGDTPQESGAALLDANTRAKALSPTVTKPVTVIIPAGVYDLGEITDATSARSDCLLMDTAYMRYVGVGNPIIKAACNIANTTLIRQTANHIKLVNLTLMGTSTYEYAGSPDSDVPSMWAPVDDLDDTVFDHVTFSHDGVIQQTRVGCEIAATFQNGCIIGADFGYTSIFSGIITGGNVFGNRFLVEGAFSGLISGQSFFGSNMLSSAVITASARLRDVVATTWAPSVVDEDAKVIHCIIDNEVYTGTGAVNTFIPVAEKGAANGVVPLGADSKIAEIFLPALAIMETHVVDDETEQLALDVQQGDIAVRTDENKSYIRNSSDTGTMDDWTWLRTHGDVVLGVAGETGVISAETLLAALETERYTAAEKAKVANVPADTNAALALKENTGNKGISGGYAALNDNGIVPFSQLPQELMGSATQIPIPGNIRMSVPTDPDGDNVFMELQIASDPGFTDIVLTADSSLDNTDWYVFSGTIWEAVPIGGISAMYKGMPVMYSVPSDLFTLGNQYYARYRGTDGVAPTGWRGTEYVANGLGSITPRPEVESLTDTDWEGLPDGALPLDETRGRIITVDGDFPGTPVLRLQATVPCYFFIKSNNTNGVTVFPPVGWNIESPFMSVVPNATVSYRTAWGWCWNGSETIWRLFHRF